MNKKEELRSRYPVNFPIPPDVLDNDKLDLILEQELTNWKVVKSPLPEDTFIIRQELFREFVFDRFDDVIAYMSKVAQICNSLPHHPRWENSWTTLKVYLSTWDHSHVITYKDIMLARHMEEIYNSENHSHINIHQANRIERQKRKFYKKIKDEIQNGSLETAINKLSDYLAKPFEIKERNKIQEVINGIRQLIEESQDISIDEIAKRTNDYKTQLDQILHVEDFIPKIYFSYAWGGDKEKVIDELYDSLNNSDKYQVVRDKVDLDYKGLISSFMKEIGKGNFVIIAISDKYLKSKYCMFELYELYRNSLLEKKLMHTKIYPILVEKIDLSDPKILRKYYEYWNDLEIEWRNLVNDFQANQENHVMINSIRNSLPPLLSFISDINSQTVELVSQNDFKKIKDLIDLRIEKLNN